MTTGESATFLTIKRGTRRNQARLQRRFSRLAKAGHGIDGRIPQLPVMLDTKYEIDRFYDRDPDS